MLLFNFEYVPDCFRHGALAIIINAIKQAHREGFACPRMPVHKNQSIFPLAQHLIHNVGTTLHKYFLAADTFVENLIVAIDFITCWLPFDLYLFII